MVGRWRDPTSKAGLLAGAGGCGRRRRIGGRTVQDGLDEAGHLEGLPLVHDEDGFEPLGESGVALDRVGVRCTLQKLDLKILKGKNNTQNEH
jgi:hypothetical protein